MVLLAHPTGNTFSRELLAELLRRDRLGLFATCVAVHGNEFFLKLLPRKLRSELLRRRFEVSSEKLFTRPARELLRVARRAAHHGVYADLDRALAERLPALKEKHDLTAVYAYEDGALEVFRRAKDLRLKCVYDLPIAYWETSYKLLREEAERWPAWKQTLPDFNDAQITQRKTEEARLADVIVCPSEFVRDSLPGGMRAVVVPFGSPSCERAPMFLAPKEKVRVLFAGSMTQRKGLADVFAAMKLLKRRDVELVVMGSPLAPMEFYRAEYSDFVYERPRPHEEVLKLMETCDVLLLPSIVEGRALVQQEAMSRGLALIATANAGGQDLLEDGRAGFLIPIRSPEAIAEKLDWIAENRERLPEMKRAAYEKARGLTWGDYTRGILEAIDGHG